MVYYNTSPRHLPRKCKYDDITTPWKLPYKTKYKLLYYPHLRKCKLTSMYNKLVDKENQINTWPPHWLKPKYFYFDSYHNKCFYYHRIKKEVKQATYFLHTYYQNKIYTKEKSKKRLKEKISQLPKKKFITDSDTSCGESLFTTDSEKSHPH